MQVLGLSWSKFLRNPFILRFSHVDSSIVGVGVEAKPIYIYDLELS